MLERKVGDLALWEFVIVLIIIHLLAGIVISFMNKS
jgi:hypothetical protein